MTKRHRGRRWRCRTIQTINMDSFPSLLVSGGTSGRPARQAGCRRVRVGEKPEQLRAGKLGTALVLEMPSGDGQAAIGGEGLELILAWMRL